MIAALGQTNQHYFRAKRGCQFNPETLRSYFNKAMEQKKSLKFQDKLKNILD